MCLAEVVAVQNSWVVSGVNLDIETEMTYQKCSVRVRIFSSVFVRWLFLPAKYLIGNG